MSHKLLSSIVVGPLTLPNRVVLAPMTRSRSGPTRVPNEINAEYYAQRASAGLLVTEATGISPQGDGWVDAPGIYTPAMVAGWRSVTKAVHAKGGHIFLQLWHMGRQSHSDFNGGALPVAPSAIAVTGAHAHTPLGRKPFEVPHALTTDEVASVVRDYGTAAARAMEAGFDGVEIHGANGYLIDQFLQGKTNHRTDEYGGSIEKRFRFLREVVEAVAAAVPIERVGVRLSPNGKYGDMGSPEYRELFTYVLQQLNQYKLAYVHVMDGLTFGFHELGAPFTLAEARAVYKGVLVGNVGYTQDTAEAAIAKGDADLIAFGRPYISNPDLVERFAHGWPLAAPAAIDDWWTPKGAAGYTDFAPHKL